MALTIDTTGTAFAYAYGHDEANWVDYKYNVAYLMMMVGMNRIKDDKDVEEMEWRLRVYKAAFGPWISSGDEGEAFYYRLLPMLVGVHTNVSQQTRAAYVKRVRENWWLDVQGNANRAVKAARAEVSA